MRKLRRITLLLSLAAICLLFLIPTYKSSAADTNDFQVSRGTLIKYTGTASNVSVPDEVKKIGAEAFAENTYITSVRIGKNVKEIEYGAFRDCTALMTVSLADTVESIGNGVFSNNHALKRVSIGKNVKKIGSGAFAGCDSLTSVSVDKDNPYFTVADNCLYSKDKTVLYSYFGGSKKTEFDMPSTVTKVMDYAFWGNDSLKEVNLSSSLREISGYAFSNCQALTTVSIPYSVRSIDSKAFENCILLEEVEIPSSVSHIHYTAFDGCSRLIINAKQGTVAYEFYQGWKKADRGQLIVKAASVIVSDIENTDESSVSQNTVSGNEAEASSQQTEGGKVYVVGSKGQVTTKDKNPVQTFGSNGTGTSASSSEAVSSETNRAANHPSNVDYIPQSDPLEYVEDGVAGQTIVVGQKAVILMDSSLRVNEGATGTN